MEIRRLAARAPADLALLAAARNGDTMAIADALAQGADPAAMQPEGTAADCIPRDPALSAAVASHGLLRAWDLLRSDTASASESLLPGEGLALDMHPVLLRSILRTGEVRSLMEYMLSPAERESATQVLGVLLRIDPAQVRQSAADAAVLYRLHLV